MYRYSNAVSLLLFAYYLFIVLTFIFAAKMHTTNVLCVCMAILEPCPYISAFEQLVVKRNLISDTRNIKIRKFYLTSSINMVAMLGQAAKDDFG